MARMHNPPHPGDILREDIFPELNLSITQAARQLGVGRVSLSRVVHGHAAISVDMARRLELWLRGPGNGPSAESWLELQLAYDLWQARQAGTPRVEAARSSP